MSDRVDLGEVVEAGDAVGPLVVAVGAVPLVGPEAVHDGLEDGGEGRDADAGGDEHRVLRAEDVGRGRAERTVDVYLPQEVAIRCAALNKAFIRAFGPYVCHIVQ